MVSWSVQLSYLDFLSLILGIYKCTDWILESLVCASPPSILTVIVTIPAAPTKPASSYHLKQQ